MSSPTSSQQHITLNVRASKDKTYLITVAPTDTVLRLKEQVALASGTSSDRIRLVYSGRVLKDPHSIDSCNVAHGNIIHMVRGPLPSTPTTFMATSAAEVAAATTARTTIPSSNNLTFASPTPFSTAQQTAGAFGSDPRPGLFSTASTTQQQLPYIPRTQPTSSNDNSHRPGLGGFAYGSNTNLSSNGAYGPGEELEMMMGQMMQDPTFAQFMSSMLQNPQILESMIATNPMLQAMLGPDMGRRVLQSPQFLQMVASPDALQQVAQSISRSASSTPMTATTTMNTGGNTNVSATHSPTSTSTTPLATTPPPSSAPGMRLLPSSLISANAPEKRFQVQLQQLSEMGFWDPTKNMRALQVTGGDVNSAIEILCSGV